MSRLLLDDIGDIDTVFMTDSQCYGIFFFFCLHTMCIGCPCVPHAGQPSSPFDMMPLLQCAGGEAHPQEQLDSDLHGPAGAGQAQ
jgi:hypothetical protein